MRPGIRKEQNVHVGFRVGEKDVLAVAHARCPVIPVR
jgi:hypothetical protein